MKWIKGNKPDTTENKECFVRFVDNFVDYDKLMWLGNKWQKVSFLEEKYITHYAFITEPEDF